MNPELLAEINRILAEETESDATNMLGYIGVDERSILQLVGSRFHNLPINDLIDLDKKTDT